MVAWIKRQFLSRGKRIAKTGQVKNPSKLDSQSKKNCLTASSKGRCLWSRYLKRRARTGKWDLRKVKRMKRWQEKFNTQSYQNDSNLQSGHFIIVRHFSFRGTRECVFLSIRNSVSFAKTRLMDIHARGII